MHGETDQRSRFRDKIRNKKLLAILGLAGLLAIGALVFIFIKPSSYFPAAVKKQAKVSLYYPVKLPAGLTVDKTSFSSPQSDVITFNIDSGGRPKYYVSLEPVPNNFDNSVFQKNFIRTDQFKAPAGDVLIGALNTVLVANIRTADKVLILINTSDVSAAIQLRSLCASFQRVN